LGEARKKIDSRRGKDFAMPKNGDTGNNANDLLTQTISETDMVNIGQEINAFLQNNTSGFNFDDRSGVVVDTIQNFTTQSHDKAKNEESENSIPEMPDMSDMLECKIVAKSLKDKLEEIVSYSEVFQPSEDEIAERILSHNDDPFHLNFNLENGNFEIDFENIPSDNRNMFVSKCDFS
jgi:nitrogen regulatory protein PII-like uncharacterized protein